MDFIVVLSNIAEELPPGRVFGMDGQLFIQTAAAIFNVLLLSGILAFLLYKPVRNVLQKRTNRIEGQLLQAEEEMQRASELRQEYEKKLEDIESEREDILAQARKYAADSSRRIIAEAKQEADSLRDRAAQTVKLEWERAESDMRATIVDVSAQMAEKFVTLAINRETHDRLFDETLSDLEGMTWRD
ncbi:MAG: F0F1 ATP synthase subunit B [Oscillospiraceae bacterium]|nr:F0F1 ATP synthase subunit B [Oscillospiraceae bacterium]